MKTDKRIEDVIHLYLGCQCIHCGEVDETKKLTGISFDDTQRVLWVYFENEENCYAPASEVKPILRPLNSMTEEEAKLCWRECGGDYATTNPKCALIDYTFHADWSYHKWVIAINWMRKNQFDVDDLIPSGLAIDKTTLK